MGIQPTGWTNDDFPEIGNDTPYQVILDQTKQADFEGGSTGHNYPSHLPSLRHAMESRGLKIASTWSGTTFTTGVDVEAELAAFHAQVSFLRDVGSQDVVVAELANAVNQDRTKAVLGDRPIFNDLQWHLLTSLLNRAGEYAHEQGMQLSYHPHVGTGVMTFDETVRLMDCTDRNYVGLCLDTAHLRYGGASQNEIEQLTNKYANRIKHVHLKNVRESVLKRALEDDFSFCEAIKRGIFTVPGDEDGELDLCPILKILQSVGYNRWLVIEAEQDPVTAAHTPLQYAIMAREFLRKNLGW